MPQTETASVHGGFWESSGPGVPKKPQNAGGDLTKRSGEVLGRNVMCCISVNYATPRSNAGENRIQNGLFFLDL